MRKYTYRLIEKLGPGCGAIEQHVGNSNYYWRYYDRDRGYNYRRSTYTANLRQARKICREWAHQHDRMRLFGEVVQPIAVGTVPLSKVVEEYFEDLLQRQRKPAPRYLKNIQQNLLGKGKIVEHFGASCPVDQITPPLIRQFGESLESMGLAGKTINRVFSTLSQVLEYAVQYGYLDGKPTIKRWAEKRTKHGQFIPADHIHAMLRAAATIGPAAVAYIALGRFSGLRVSEAIRVRWEDIEWERGAIVLRQQKNQTDMPAPLLRTRAYLWLGERENRSGPVVRGLRGVPIATDSRALWHRIQSIAGLEGYKYQYHDLRRTFIRSLEESNKLSDSQLGKLIRHLDYRSKQSYLDAEWGPAIRAAQKK